MKIKCPNLVTARVTKENQIGEWRELEGKAVTSHVASFDKIVFVCIRDTLQYAVVFLIQLWNSYSNSLCYLQLFEISENLGIGLKKFRDDSEIRWPTLIKGSEFIIGTTTNIILFIFLVREKLFFSRSILSILFE